MLECRRAARGLRSFLLALFSASISVGTASADLTPGALLLTPNFHTIGVRASFATSGGAAGNDAVVEYRRPSEPTWRTAPPAWLDVRSALAYAGDVPNWARNEARTKIFGLAPGVAYEVRVTFTGAVAGGAIVSDTVTTRPLTPPTPALRTLYVNGAAGDDAADGLSPATAKRTLASAFASATAGDQIWVAPGVYTHAAPAVLTASGTPSDWIRVTRWPALPGEAILEGTGTNDYVVRLTGSYVRVDGLVLRKARAAVLRIEGNTTDHWIDGNRITDWNVDDDPGVQHEGGITAWSNATRLTVLENQLRYRDVLPGVQNGGGNGVWVKNQLESGIGGGQHVIRGNTIVGGWDGIGSDVEADPRGGFYVDTDVYENVIADPQDDAIQMEGANLNCAVFANEVYRGRTGIAFAPTGIGPLFVVRNRVLGPTWSPTGPLYKIGANSDGRTWLFHESGYERDAGPGSGGDGLQQTNPGLANLVARNNAWQVDRYVVETTSALAGPGLDFDHDALFTTDAAGRFIKWFQAARASLAAFQGTDGQEPHGLERAMAALDWTNAAAGDLTLHASAALRDAGATITGINDGLEDPRWNRAGGAPDVGAFEWTGADVTPPSVAVADPPAEAVVAGLVTVGVDASDADGVDASDAAGVAGVDFWIDGTLAGSDASAPYGLPWTTTAVGDGAHLLEARAHDAAGNVGRSAIVRVLVDNGHGGPRNAAIRYKAKRTAGTFTAAEREVVDAFETKRAVVQKPHSVANPAVAGSGAIVDPTAYLTCYEIKDAADEPRSPVRQVTIADAFGAARWELRKAVELCVPSARDGGAPDPAHDAFKCWQAKTAPQTPKFASRTVMARDDFGTVRLVAQKPSMYCTAARADGSAIADPPSRLACYRSKIAPGEPRFSPVPVDATDALASLGLSATKPDTLCLPATETPVP